MSAIHLAVRQPVTVVVGIILIVLSGLLALQRIPIQLTPDVEDMVVTVTTTWEGASPNEVEQEIVEKQEEVLQGLANLRAMTSSSTQGAGVVRLEFKVGTLKSDAMRETNIRLREVPDYPQNADEPIIEATDPENRDYIAWIVFGTTDENLDIRTLQDFAEDHIEPALERVEGISEVNVLGGRERETQIRFDPVLLAQHGITQTQLATSIERSNRNVAAGLLSDGKNEYRVRTIGQFDSIVDIERTIVTYVDGGPIYIGDLAEVVETYKEPDSFVRSRGEPVIAINAQKEVGSNIIEVMTGLRAAIAELGIEGGVLDTQTRKLGLDGKLVLDQVYDQTVYIDDALALVRNNIWLGGTLAVLVLLLFLRSLRSVGVIALAIPISVIGAVVVMVILGRTVNVISLAGMAFAVGMVVDNAIVVLENIHRHLEMGKSPTQAALDGTREVWGAVLASTLTTIVVFVPILLVQEEVGQLFRDIALAICAALALSLVVSVTVIPSAAARVMRRDARGQKGVHRKSPSLFTTIQAIPAAVAQIVYWLCGSTLARLTLVTVLTAASIVGALQLMPPADYLPQGNRNLVFGMLTPPPGYSLGQQVELAQRIEQTIAPFWEAGRLDPSSGAYADAMAALPSVPGVSWGGPPGPPVFPPPITNYFIVAGGNFMFHGGVTSEPRRVADLHPLFAHATRPEVLPDVRAINFQLPLFRVGGSSGSAVRVDLSADDLDSASAAASAVFLDLMQSPGTQSVQPSPSNFNVAPPEIRVIPDQLRLAELGMRPLDLALAVQAGGDGAIIGEYRIGGDTIDLKLISRDAVEQQRLPSLIDRPIATPTGHVVPLGSIAEFQRTTSPAQINHVERRRSVSLQVTASAGVPLEQAVDEITTILDARRQAGAIPSHVEISLSGSASKLREVQLALLGDGSVLGALNSSLVLAFAAVYLVMCVLFQSFIRPFVIMFSVPLALVGGFAALAVVKKWSEIDPYMPPQTLDVLSMLGFIILMGVVVNNAILIVHQAGNFMSGKALTGDGSQEPMEPRRAISEAVRTRIRPIFMGAMTSVGGLLPLVLMPGSGSELYRGLGGVVVGGLVVSTVFTVLLVPLLLSLMLDFQRWLTGGVKHREDASAPQVTAALDQ